MPLNLLYRTAGAWGAGTGANLSAVQFDTNNYNIQTFVNGLETAIASIPAGNGIDDFSFVGNLMTVIMTDATTRGPFAINVGWVLREEWLAGETYLKNNLVIGPVGTPYDGAAYMVQVNHVADVAFDPLATDGFANRLYRLLIPALKPAVPINDIHVFVPGVMIDAQLILDYGSTRPWTLAANLVGSIFQSVVAAVAPTTVHLFQNDTEIGTINWAAGALVPTVSFIFRVDFATGDRFRILGPAVADGNLADTSLDFVGNRL